MARKSGSMICTSECVKCIHSDLNEDIIFPKFHCFAKNKDYIYGQYVPCDFKELRKDGATMQSGNNGTIIRNVQR